MSARSTLVRLAPILVAFLSLVSISLLGFVVALWPADQPSASARPQSFNEPPAPVQQSYEGGSHYIPEPRSARGKWM